MMRLLRNDGISIMEHTSYRCLCKLSFLWVLILISIRNSEASRHTAAIRPVLISGSYGGLGNQLYYLCENILLARQGNLTYVPPPLSIRHLPRNDKSFQHPDVEYDKFLDSRYLTRIVNISRTLPRHCGGGVHHVFVGRRHGVISHQQPRFTAAARMLIGDSSNETDASRDRRFVRNAKIHRRFLPMEHGANYSFVKELSSLQGSCIFLDGHSFFRKGAESLEYLYSFMHYIESAPQVKRLADEWDTNNLCVLHLRYDEYECVPDVARMSGKICIRRRLKMGRKGTVIWTDVKSLARRVIEAMYKKGASSLYLATSPYVPEESRKQLISLLSKQVRVVPGVPDEMGAMEKNFVERELAIRAKLFIGDFASTWSGTLYYKRRTMGRETEWTCSLLGECSDMAFYGNKEKLEPPQWFETKYYFRPTSNDL